MTFGSPNGLDAPPPALSPARLAALEATVQDAISRRRYEGLTILGQGEVSCVLRWDGLACKRLPPFRSAERALAYGRNIDDYVARLRRRGIPVLGTRVQICESRPGWFAAYCIQPALPPAALAIAAFRRGDGGRIERWFDRIAGHVARVVDAGTGLDAQVSNWAILGTEPVYLDVTTPFMLGPDGAATLDAEILVAALPLAVRGAARRFAVEGLIARYHRPRMVMCDLLANLCKDGLGRLVPLLLERGNRSLAAPLTLAEIARYHRHDARLFGWLRRLRRLESAVLSGLAPPAGRSLLLPSTAGHTS